MHGRLGSETGKRAWRYLLIWTFGQVRLMTWWFADSVNKMCALMSCVFVRLMRMSRWSSSTLDGVAFVAICEEQPRKDL